ncbi:hypothetical protein [Buttiauxella agrestis]|uniref:hypothetical protein n=1 Tax=Buttiauxella agrestis TaxID=82977 RepID=UPI0015609008|nr:hypothetical protein [Buttiauxella agrestis]BCG10575.1 hypothetical protein BADSM9389_32570 [Buttiauxella agrestis]
MKYFFCRIKIVAIKFLNLKITMMLFFFVSPLAYVTASEDVVLQKHIYGLRQFSQVKGAKYLPPVIEPLPYTDLKVNGDDIKIYPYYDIGEYESEMEQNKRQVDIHLTVQQKNSSAFATVNFYNRSLQTYFVHRSRLAREEEQPLCSDTFSIATEGIRLVYLGWRCQFEDEDNDKKPDWQEILAGKTFSYTLKLNDAYLFPPGKRRYNIGTLEFFMANDTFFHEKRIYNTVFSILNWKFGSCETDKYSYFIQNINELCKVIDPWKEDTAEGLLRKFDYDGFSPANFFEARSNQVIINIDGDMLTSPYDMNKTKFTN